MRAGAQLRHFVRWRLECQNRQGNEPGEKGFHDGSPSEPGGGEAAGGGPRGGRESEALPPVLPRAVPHGCCGESGAPRLLLQAPRRQPIVLTVPAYLHQVPVASPSATGQSQSRWTARYRTSKPTTNRELGMVKWSCSGDRGTTEDWLLGTFWHMLAHCGARAFCSTLVVGRICPISQATYLRV
jgi:hypothetical protein